MAELHWRCTYLANIYDKDKFDGLSGYKFEFTDETIRSIFFETNYGNTENDVEKNTSSIEASEEKLVLSSEGWIAFEDEKPYFFPLMTEEEIEQVNSGDFFKGNSLVSVGVIVELDGYETYTSEPERRANVQYLNFDWSYNDFNGGNGEFEEIETLENNIEMAQAPLIPETKWIWKVFCHFNVSGTTNTAQPVYYPLDDYKLQVFSGSNIPGIETFISGNTPNTIYSTGTSLLNYENVLSTTTVTADAAHNYYPIDFWTLAQQGVYSAITSDNFYYSLSGAGHQSSVFSGGYSIYGICIEHGNVQHYNPSDINNIARGWVISNKATLNANYFSLHVIDDFNDVNISMVDVGLGHAGSALTGLYGTVSVISSAIPFSDGMPCFVSRIGSPGEFTVVPPNSTQEVHLKSTGEIASTNRARSLWSTFDDSSALYYHDINGELGFTPNDIYNAGNLENKFWFSDGYQQDDNRLILTSDMLGYLGTPNYFVDELQLTTWTYSNYTTNLEGASVTSLYPGIGEVLFGNINVSANTKYIVCLPSFKTDEDENQSVYEISLNFRVGTEQVSVLLHHIYRGPNWNTNTNMYNSLSGKWFCPGAILFQTPSNYEGPINLYATLVHCQNVETLGSGKLYLWQHTIFYHPLLKDNYLDVNGPRPVDVADM